MTLLAVGFDGVRADAMDTTANISSIGGGAGAGVEDEAYYQNGLAISRKVTNAGFFSDTGAQRDFTAAGRRVVLYKVLVTNYAGITLLEARIGSAGTAYGEYLLADNTTVNYQPVGGFLLIPIDPTIAGYRNATVGNPDMSVADYFGIFASGPQSKAENLVMDAIDIGSGFYVTGGTGADPVATFQDFVDDDEGDPTTGRFGFISTKEGILFVYGKLTIGATAALEVLTSAATEFTDNGQTIVFPDGWFGADFSGLVIDLGDAGTIIDASNNSYISRGTVSIADTRAVFKVVGVSGAGNFSSASFVNFAGLTLTSGVDFSNAILQNCEEITPALGDMSNALVSKFTGASALIWDETSDPNIYLHGTVFVGNSNHAIRFDSNTPAVINLSAQSYSGYNAAVGSNLVANSGPTDATIFNDSGKAITINVINSGGAISVRNGVGATTTVVSGLVTVQVTVYDDETGLPLPNSHVQLVKSSDKSVLLSGAVDGSGVISTGITYVSDTPVEGWVRQWDLLGVDYTPKNISGTITNTGLLLDVRLNPI